MLLEQQLFVEVHCPSVRARWEPAEKFWPATCRAATDTRARLPAIDLTFVLAGDSNFAMQLAVAMQSVARAHPDHSCEVYALHDGIDVPLRRRVTDQLPPNATITWIEAGSDAVGMAKRPAFLPPASLFRLQVASVLPPSATRAIYLDADLIVRHDLALLWSTDVGDTTLAAVQDPLIPWCGAPGGLPWRKLGLAPATPYFNAGVIVIPLDRWREEKVEERSLDLMSTYSFRLADQCALNAVAAGNWTKVDPTWNMQSGHLHPSSLASVVEDERALDHALSDPAIVHFTSVMKRPWLKGCTHPFRGEWADLLRHTAWADWTPRLERRRAIAATRARTRSAIRVLRGRSVSG